MDPWKFYHIIHRYHTIMNPVNEKELDRLFDLLELKRTGSVVDIGCGKGEMLTRLAEKYHVKGVGVDKSPYFIQESLRLKEQRVPHANLKFVQMDGAQYKPEKDVDLSMCIGASWIYGGYRNTVTALARMTKPSGHVMIGEPFWRKEPPQEYLDSEKMTRDSFDTHHGNSTCPEKEGLRLVYALVASEQDWDRYECLHWFAANQFASLNPNDPDVGELLALDAKAKESYLRWGREFFGWAIYVFQKPNG